MISTSYAWTLKQARSFHNTIDRYRSLRDKSASHVCCWLVATRWDTIQLCSHQPETFPLREDVQNCVPSVRSFLMCSLQIWITGLRNFFEGLISAVRKKVWLPMWFDQCVSLNLITMDVSFDYNKQMPLPFFFGHWHSSQFLSVTVTWIVLTEAILGWRLLEMDVSQSSLTISNPIKHRNVVGCSCECWSCPV